MSDEEDAVVLRPSKRRRARVQEDNEGVENEFEELENIINQKVEGKIDDEDELDEDDLYLIRENSNLINTRKRSSRAYFAESDDEEPPTRRLQKSYDTNEYVGTDDELDDFIVDDLDGEPQGRDGTSAPPRRRDARKCAEANEIFGADFDHQEIEALVNANDVTQKQGLLGVIDPSEVEQSHLTHEDVELCLKDLPERMLRRSKEVEDCGDIELDLEAEWIFDHAFKKDVVFSNAKVKENIRSTPRGKFIECIKIVLNAIRILKFDIPFIIHYRKEIYRPWLLDDDLWLIFDYDNEFMHLNDHKKKIINLVTQMINYQQFIANSDKYNTLIDIGKIISVSELEKVRKIFEFPEIHDYYRYFQFCHMSKLRKLHDFLQIHVDPEDMRAIKIVELNEQKEPEKFDHFEYCKKYNFIELFNHVGISDTELAENISGSFPKYIPRASIDPNILASAYITSFLTDPVSVVDHICKLWADELAHNIMIVREARKFFFGNAKISCHPSQLGLRQIDSMHPYSDFKYLKHKPIDAFSHEEYLQLNIAESQGLINVTISVFNQSGKTFIDVCRPFFERDDGNPSSTSWNEFRLRAFSICYSDILFPKLKKEFCDTLMLDAQKYIAHLSSELLKNHLVISADPHKLDAGYIFSIVLPPFQNLSGKKPADINDGTCAIISSDGALIESFILDSALYVASYKHIEFTKSRIQTSLYRLFNKITFYKPIAIVFSLECKNVIALSKLIEDEIANNKTLEDPPRVEVINNLIPGLASKSIVYKKEFPAMSIIDKHAVSAGRYSIDPLLEILQLFEYPDDILPIFVNQYYQCLSKDYLFTQYQRVLIDVVNSIGVDINRCISDYRYANIFKYIAGMGPSKASHILLKMRKIGTKIRGRHVLVQDLEIGPNVFINSAGFIKINADIEIDEDVEPFDTTRIHPESYNLAKEILATIFQINNIDDVNCVELMLELVVKPQLLHSIDYHKMRTRWKILSDSSDASFTFDDIKSELASPFEDKRPSYKPLSEEGLFWVLGTKGVFFDREFINDPFNPLAIGNTISGVVTSYTTSKPSQNKIRDMLYKDEAVSGNYVCPFCKDSSFEKINDVLEHCENDCSGLIVGVRVKLDNELLGFIPRENIISDKRDNIKEKLEIGMAVNPRIVGINESKFSIELSYKSSEAFTFKVGEKSRDRYYDFVNEKLDLFKVQEKKEKLSNRVVYHKKLILHPLFKNLTYNESEKYMAQNPDADCVVRPSSRGVDRLTATIRIVDDILYHVEIREEEKATDFTLGKKLWIQNRSYEDLDEIYACFITPFLTYFAEAIKSKSYYFVNDMDQPMIISELKKRLEVQPKTIPYLISVSKTYPGKLFIAYLQKTGLLFQYVSVNPDGFKTKEIVHPNLESLLTWFKGRTQDKPSAPKSTTYTPMYEDQIGQMPKYPQQSGMRNTPMSHQTPNPVHAWQQR